MDDKFNDHQENDEVVHHTEEPVPTEETGFTDPNKGETSYSPFYQQSESNNGSYNYNTNYNTGTQYSPQNNRQEDQSVLSMGEWLLTILVMFIPCVGIGVYIYWAFSQSGNVNRRNFCRAQLIVTIAMTIIGIILWILLIAAVMPYIGNVSKYYY